MGGWVELLGFVGSGCTVAAYAMREMVALRTAAVLSSLAFLGYGTLTGSLPLVAMELVLVPINGLRLVEALRARRLQAVR